MEQATQEQGVNSFVARGPVPQGFQAQGGPEASLPPTALAPQGAAQGTAQQQPQLLPGSQDQASQLPTQQQQQQPPPQQQQPPQQQFPTPYFPVQLPPIHDETARVSKSVIHHLDHCNLEKCLDLLLETPPKNIHIESIARLLTKCMVIGNMGAAIEVVDILLPQKKMRLKIEHLTQALSQVSQRSPVGRLRQFMQLCEKVLEFQEGASPAYHKPRNEYCSHFLKLLVLEFLEEAAQCLEKLNAFPITWLEDQGLCATELNPEYCRGAGVVLFKSEKRGAHMSAAPATVVKGDSVLVTVLDKKNEIKCVSEMEAEVLTITPHFTIKVIGLPQSFSWEHMLPARWRVDKMANRVTFSRQLEGVKNLTGARPEVVSRANQASVADQVICGAILSAGCFPSSNSAKSKKKEKVDMNIEAMCASAPPSLSPTRVQQLSRRIDMTEDLNRSQRNAIKAALSRRLTLIHGPPGTGKTHTAVSIVQAWLEANAGPVLCTSDSNTAVDNLVSGLAHTGISVLRIGRPESVRSDLNQYTLDALTADRPRDTPEQRKEIYRIQKEKLMQAQAVCATCSGSGSDILDRIPFFSVLLDEASQATEPSCIVPIMHGATQVALVGDHRQLPPTILSREADNGGLGVSLFDRLVRAGVSAHLLDTQYRMHPALMLYPSMTFYNNTVKSGVPSAMREPVRGFKWPILGVPAAFVPVENGLEHQDGTSQTNQKEAERVSATVNQLLASNPDLKPSNIGIITPYASQVRLLRKMLQAHRSAGDSDKESPEVGLEINSVDGFQGREKEVILVSAVRANKQGDVGFLSDVRRMNVTLTRAKRGLIVFGHTPTLRHDATCWNPWLMWCYGCGLVMGCAATDTVASAALSKVDKEDGPTRLCNAPPVLPPAEDDDCWTCVPPCSSINDLDDDTCCGCGKARPPRSSKDFEEQLSDTDDVGGLREPPPCDWEGGQQPPPCDWEDDALPDALPSEVPEDTGPINTNTYIEFEQVEPAAPFQEWRDADGIMSKPKKEGKEAPNTPELTHLTQLPAVMQGPTREAPPQKAPMQHQPQQQHQPPAQMLPPSNYAPPTAAGVPTAQPVMEKVSMTPSGSPKGDNSGKKGGKKGKKGGKGGKDRGEKGERNDRNERNDRSEGFRNDSWRNGPATVPTAAMPLKQEPVVEKPVAVAAPPPPAPAPVVEEDEKSDGGWGDEPDIDLAPSTAPVRVPPTAGRREEPAHREEPEHKEEPPRSNDYSYNKGHGYKGGKGRQPRREFEDDPNDPRESKFSRGGKKGHHGKHGGKGGKGGKKSGGKDDFRKPPATSGGSAFDAWSRSRMGN